MLRLQFQNRTLRCDVGGPADDGRYWLRFFLVQGEDAPDKLDVTFELFDDIKADIDRHGIAEAGMWGGFDEEEKAVFIDVAFQPRDLMAAYQYQLSFGQQGRAR